jgi:hypothetical protein
VTGGHYFDNQRHSFRVGSVGISPRSQKDFQVVVVTLAAISIECKFAWSLVIWSDVFRKRPTPRLLGCSLRTDISFIFRKLQSRQFGL